jgi:hypothetical protein
MILWILLVFVVVSPFSSLTLLIWVFSLLCFVMLPLKQRRLGRQGGMCLSSVHIGEAGLLVLSTE